MGKIRIFRAMAGDGGWLPLFTMEQLESRGGATSSSFDMATLIALFCFVGVVVTATRV